MNGTSDIALLTSISRYLLLQIYWPAADNYCSSNASRWLQTLPVLYTERYQWERCFWGNLTGWVLMAQGVSGVKLTSKYSMEAFHSTTHVVKQYKLADKHYKSVMYSGFTHSHCLFDNDQYWLGLQVLQSWHLAHTIQVYLLCTHLCKQQKCRQMKENKKQETWQQLYLCHWWIG